MTFDQQRDSRWALHEDCVDMQVHCYETNERVARLTARRSTCECAIQAFSPLVRQWYGRVTPEVRTMIHDMLFWMDPADWVHYPQFVRAINDPILPHHPGHYLRCELPQGHIREMRSGTFRLDSRSMSLWIQHGYLSQVEKSLRRAMWFFEWRRIIVLGDANIFSTMHPQQLLF